MIATCPTCRNTGAIGERYCTCEVAQALRARIDADPRIQQLRAEIDRYLDAPEPVYLSVPAYQGVARLDDEN